MRDQWAVRVSPDEVKSVLPLGYLATNPAGSIHGVPV